MFVFEDWFHPEITKSMTSRKTIRRPETGFAMCLGVAQDKSLSFLHHIEAVELKLSHNLGIIKKLKYTFPQKNPSSTLQQTSEVSSPVLFDNLAVNVQIRRQKT